MSHLPWWEFFLIIIGGLCLLFWVVIPLISAAFTALCWIVIGLILKFTGVLDDAVKWLKENSKGDL